jgi:hypothetical protein
MAKYYRWSFAILIFHISAFAFAGSVVDMPIGDIGRVRYGPYGHSALEGRHIAIRELISGEKTLYSFASLSFNTAKGMGKSGDSLLYGPGGQIVVRGSVRRGVGKAPFRGILMRGTFLDAKLVDDDGKLTLVADFVEHLNPLIAAMLGVPVESRGTLDLLLSDHSSHPWIVDRVTGGSLNILSEPPSVATLGSSLLGLLLAVGASGIIRRGNCKNRNLGGSVSALSGSEVVVHRS